VSQFLLCNYDTVPTIWFLTPKGPLVPMGDKPILGYVVWSHTIFGFFETFCEDASQNKLCVSANFMILRANTIFVKTAQGMWKCQKWCFCEYEGCQCRCNFCRGNLYYKCHACMRREVCSEIVISNQTIEIK
jgi:hypothetical protein